MSTGKSRPTITWHYGWNVAACGNTHTSRIMVTPALVTCERCRSTTLFKDEWYETHRFPPGTKLVKVP